MRFTEQDDTCLFISTQTMTNACDIIYAVYAVQGLAAFLRVDLRQNDSVFNAARLQQTLRQGRRLARLTAHGQSNSQSTSQSMVCQAPVKIARQIKVSASGGPKTRQFIRTSLELDRLPGSQSSNVRRLIPNNALTQTNAHDTR